MNKGIGILAVSLFLLSFPALALASKTHSVKKNDSLHSLSKKYHVSVRDIKSANNLVNRRLKPGDKLVIPSGTVAASSDASSSLKHKGSSYKVRKGDSLAMIAKRTGVSVSDLKRINGIHGKKVKPGKVLVLRDAAPVEEAAARPEKKFTARNPEIFSPDEYERTMLELTDGDGERPFELGRNAEVSPDATKQLKKSAFSFLGTRYRFGGNSRNGMDCSSFVQHVFRELSINLPRTAREQFGTGEAVTSYDLQKGDLVFFRTYASYPSHVGIYLGENKMIHASSRDRKVVISSMNTPYYRSRFIGAKRFSQINPVTVHLEDLFAGADVTVEKEEDVLKNDTLGLELSN
jgi:LysM repeat protein